MIKEIERINEASVVGLAKCAHFVLKYEVVCEVLIDCPYDWKRKL